MRAVLLTLVLAIAGALFAAWFFTTHERVVVEVPSGYRGEARANRFFAAERLLRNVGLEADSRASLTPSEWLPATGDTLLARSSATFASAEELARLELWVLSGGHLVLLAPEPPAAATDAVFEHFGFRPIDTQPAEGDSDERVLAAAWTKDPDAAAYVIGPVGLLQRFDVTEDDFLLGALRDRQGVFVARRPWGDGYVTAVAGSSLFENAFLADFDHARLLLDVVAGSIQPGKVWLVYGVEFPPLWRLVWTHAPYAVTGIAAVLVLWLWSVMPRFGPLVTADAPVRRSILEHVEAAAHFVRRHDGAETLVASSTAAVLRRAERTHPGIARLPAAEQAAAIAEMTGHDEPAVLAALASAGDLTPRELVHKIQALQTIRKKL
ncbi:MAG TPA: DUF4350 domain-containing protein [Gammaproteobacteria bacterium]